ncbi:MAG: hypothetical protein MHMPM18_003176 [Marteilia pararefringens]
MPDVGLFNPWDLHEARAFDHLFKHPHHICRECVKCRMGDGLAHNSLSSVSG